MPLISVIVPCFNQGAFLPEALKSVLEQTYSDWECIIVNDGSTDKSETVALEWCKHDNRFRYLKKNNGGLSSARNAGLNISSGDYVQFLDADDLIHPEKFTLQIDSLKFSGLNSVSVSDYLPFSEETGDFNPHRYLSPFLDTGQFLLDVIIDWENKKSIPCHCFLIPLNLIKEHHLIFDEELPNHEDWLFWCQLFFYTKQLLFNKEKLALYRIRNDSMCADVNLMNKGFYLAAKKLKNFLLKEGADQLTIKIADKKIKEVKSKMYEDSTDFVKFIRKLW